MGSEKPPKDALTADAAGQTISLGSTLGNFATRMKRKLRERENRDEESQRDTECRHSRMLQALNIIRRALQETGQIQLGDRFELGFEVSDWEGWPRLSLNLLDRLIPDRIDYALLVTAHDRKALGTVELRMKSGQLLGQVHLQSESELERIPVVLKRAVRSFLDAVAEYVLNPAAPTESTRIASDLLDEQEMLDEHAEQLSTQDLFSEDGYSVRDNQVAAVEAPGALSASFETEQKKPSRS